jgi:hypothetical protein
LGGPYPVVTWVALWRHGVGSSGSIATCLGMRTTVDGVFSILWCCSDAPCHTWSCGWHGYGMLVLVVLIGIENRGLEGENYGLISPRSWE